MKAILPLILVLLAAGCASRPARPAPPNLKSQISNLKSESPRLMASPARTASAVNPPPEGKAPFVWLDCSPPPGAKELVWLYSQDLQAWHPWITNHSSFYTGLPCTPCFWRVRYQMN